MKTLRRSYEAYAKHAIAATKEENFQLPEELTRLKLSKTKANYGAKTKTKFIAGTTGTQDPNATVAQRAQTINEQPRVDTPTHKAAQMNTGKSSTHPATAMKPKEETPSCPRSLKRSS